MEIPTAGQFITYCGCYDAATCDSAHVHLRKPFLSKRSKVTGAYVKKEVPHMCHVSTKGTLEWAIYNLGFWPYEQYDIDAARKLFVGGENNDQIAVATYPWLSTPANLKYYNNVRAVTAEYHCGADIRFLALEERVAELENFIARHLYYAPDGPGAVNAAEEFKALIKDIAQ